LRYRALIAAVKGEDALTVRCLLVAGADANARDIPRDDRSFWDRLSDLLHSRHPRRYYAHPVLVLAILSEPERSPGAPPGGDGMGRPGVVRALLEHGADPNAIFYYVNFDGPVCRVSVLGYAARRGHTDCAGLLLSHGADVNALDSAGASILMNAVSEPPDPGAPRTALVRMLLDRGANVAVRDKYGRSALSLARLCGAGQEVVEMLRRAGARR
jgi:hypothetical protein